MLKDFSADLPRLLEFIEQQSDTRRKAGDLFNVQEAIDETAVNLFDAVKEMLQEKTGKRYSLVETDEMRERMDNARLNEKSVREAMYDALDHADAGRDNLIKIGSIPSSISLVTGINGDLYIYRNHAYENIVSKDRAKAEGRYDEKAHYHNIGEEEYVNAILSIKDPVLTIGETSKRGNPALFMILDQNGENRAPLSAGFEFYANQAINKSFERKPHIVLTISERAWNRSGIRDGYSEIVQKAIDADRVLQFNKEKEGNLSVMAHTVSMGDITESSLKKNVAQFRKEVNAIKEKNRINYSLDTDSKRAQREKGIWALKDNSRMLDAKIGDGGDKYVSVAFDIHARMRYT